MIETETVLLPHLIAEPFAYDVVPRDERWSESMETLIESLCARAEYLFIHNSNFRERVLSGGESARNYLSMFFKHWSQAWKVNPAQWERLPKNFTPCAAQQTARQESLF